MTKISVMIPPGDKTTGVKLWCYRCRKYVSYKFEASNKVRTIVSCFGCGKKTSVAIGSGEFRFSDLVNTLTDESTTPTIIEYISTFRFI